MMRVKKRNILEIILGSLCMLVLFIPGMFLEEYWKWDRDASTSIFGVNFHGVMSLERETPISFLEAAFDTTTLMQFLGLAVFAVLIFTIAFMVRQLISMGEGRNALSVAVFSIISFILFAGFAVALIFTEQESINYSLSYGLNWLFYLVAALFLALAALCLIGYHQAKQHGIIQEKTPVDDLPQSSVSVADELLKYKELKDAGVITDEEFLAIKKKLL